MRLAPTGVFPLALAATLAAAATGCGARGHGVGSDAAVASCVGTCPDLGSRPANCAAEEAGLEFLNIWDFDGTKNFPDGVSRPYGRGMYAYTDKSTPNILPNGYEQAATAVDRCGPTNAMHIHGGPFRGWGGGIGIGFKNIDHSACGSPLDQRPEFCPASSDFDTLLLDVSKWDGVSLWARRGPNGQASIRVGLGDTDTDDDISYKTSKDPTRTRNCERNLECSCANNKPCSPYTTTSATPGGPPVVTYYCWDPTSGVPPVTTGDERTLATDKCALSRCTADYPAYPGEGDEHFSASACTPYSFSTGTGASYCYTPGTDHEPYDNNQTCGDHWVFPVAVSNDWHLYLIPFTALQQQGFGKKFTQPQLSAVSMMRLMWDVGWVDYWVDDVGFYRVRK